MIQVYDGHPHALLCLISCCSSLWVVTQICYKIEPFLYSTCKNGQNASKTTHKDTKTIIHAVIWYKNPFVRNAFFVNWMVSTYSNDSEMTCQYVL